MKPYAALFSALVLISVTIVPAVGFGAASNQPALDRNVQVTIEEDSKVNQITNASLDSSDPDGDSVTYNVTVGVANGRLFVDGSGSGSANELLDDGESVGTGSFTQANIDNGRLYYSHDGSESANDSFEFDVTDGNGSSSGPHTFSINVTAVDDPPALTTSSDGTNYTASASGFVVDENLTVTDPDGGTIDGATVAIGSGFDANVDALGVNSTAVSNVSLTSSYNSTTGVLTLTGSASAAEMQTVLRTVTYTYSGESSAAARELDVSFALGTGGDTVFNPATDHYYELVSDSKKWEEAKSAAESRSHLGLEGYLATLTSERENDETASRFTFDRAWIGASDASTEGDWKWVTGPERGTLFWKGDESGSEQNEEYAGWASAEPNNANQGQNYAYIKGQPTFEWIDQVNGVDYNYLVEYGGLNGSSSTIAQRNVTINNDGPTLTTSSAGTNYTASAGGFVIDENLTVAAPDGGTINGATVAIGSGFDASEDTLAVNDTVVSNAGLTSSYNSTTGVLTVGGNASAAEMQAMLRTVTYTYSGRSSAPARELDISFALGTGGDTVFDPTTDHYYEYVSDGVAWDTAKSDAENRSHLGLDGYLATITSRAENDALARLQAGWIGGSDAASEGTWRWVTGPENGTQFSDGSGAGIDGSFTNWNGNNPDNNDVNTGQTEDHARTDADGTWNDVNSTVMTGYLVEYGGLAGGPSVTAQRNVTVDNDGPTLTTSPESVTNTTEGGGYLVDGNLTVTDSDGGSIDNATVSIGQGFDSSRDKLSVNTTLANDRDLTSTYNGTTGVLNISANSSATVTAEDFQAVLRTVTYSFTGASTSNGTVRTVPVRFTLNANREQVTAYDGHYYEFVSDSVSWKTAKSDAENRSHLGLEGYLATLTSQEEDDEIQSQFTDEAWIGASDADTEGDWTWVTGPENGTLFWRGDSSGSEQNGAYAGWKSDEPNDGSGEDYAEINFQGGWNDRTGDSQGYLVEYGGLTADSAITAQGNVTVDTVAPNVTDVTIKRIGGGGVVTTNDTIEVSATVTDASPIQSVTADANPFDVGTVNLTDDGPNSTAADDVYSATFTVGSDPSERDQSVTVRATDDAGNGGTPPGDIVYDSITVNPEGTTDFRTVNLPRSFENPVVIAKPLGSTSPGKDGFDVPNDKRGTPRVRNVQSTSFEIRVEEWSVQDDETHPPANVSYIVAEAGTTTLDDGTKVSAGTIELSENDGFRSITFEEPLSNPVAFANVQTANDMDSVSTRDKSVDSNGFSSKIEDDQDSGTDGNPQGTETLGYIAIEQGDSVLGETGFTAGTRGNVDEKLASINFGDSYPAGFVAAMQTNGGSEESYLRYDGRTDTGVEVRIEEDPVDNSDGHVSNTVGYLAWNESTQAAGTRSNTIAVDTSPPSIDSVTITRTGGTAPLSEGDTFDINATVSEAGSIATATADVSALDAETDSVVLTDTGNGNFTGSVTVGANPALSREVIVSVTDSLGSTATRSAIAGSKASWEHTVNGTVQTGTFAGNGSTVDPYIVDSLVDLQAINKNATTRGYNYQLGTDLDASTTRSWNDGDGFVPVGAVNGRDSGDAFSGSLVGGGHTISNLSVDQSSTNALGLVGKLGPGGTIDNLTLQNASVTGNNQIGGIAGVSAGEITNVSVDGTVAGNNQIGGAVGEVNSGGTVNDTTAAVTVDGNYQIGGLIGDLDPSEATTISGVTANGTVTGSNQYVGGLIGDADGSNGGITIADAHADGDVTEASGNNNDHVGGLIGELTGAGDLTNVSAAGTVRANGSEVGGLVGRLDHVDSGNYILENASATGTVSTGGNYVGGLVGRHRYAKAVTNASATGDVTTGGNQAGGLFGYSDSAEMNNTSATGAVTTDGNQAGGLIGNFEGGTIADSTATGDVKSSSNGYVGGLVGYYDDNSGADSAIKNVSATGDVSGSGRYVGGLIGQSQTTDNDGTTITEAHAAGDVTEASGQSNNEVGGLIGVIHSAGDITDVSATGAVRANGSEVGGLVGELDHERAGYRDRRHPYGLKNASATGNVTTDGSYVGGLVGHHRFAKVITNASAAGNVTTDENQVGGLIGKLRGGIVTDSVARGDVESGSNGYVGGLVGYYSHRNGRGDSRLRNVSAAGDVAGSGRYVGGLIGRSRTTGNDGTSITEAHADGDVTEASGNGNNEVGGLIGEITSAGDITDVSATGAVRANGSEVGGLVGRLNHERAGYRDRRHPYGLKNASATGNVTTDGSYVGGLVGRHRFAKVVTNASATGEVTAGGNYAGGLFGSSRSRSIETASATGNVTTDGNQVGGLLGKLRGGTVTDSVARGDVESGSNGYVGGLVGYYSHRNGRGDSRLRNVSAAGDVTGSGRYVGGLIGRSRTTGNDGTSITEAHAEGNVTEASGQSNNEVGGLIGEIGSAGDITNVSATGAVRANGSEVGGLVGRLDHERAGYRDRRHPYGLKNASATGEVRADGSYVGGLVGRHRFAKVVTNASAAGDVTTDGNQVGGLIGKLRGGTVTDAVARGDVESGSNGYVGGLVGYYSHRNGRVDSRLRNVSAAGDVAGSGRYVGGLIGRSRTTSNDGTTITEAHADGDVTEASGNGNNEVGGLIGEITSAGDITDVSATGAVRASGSEVGGLVGRLDHERAGFRDRRHPYGLKNASATGNVTTDGRYVGGLVGRHRFAKVVTNASAAGDVTADGDRVGGLIGRLRGGDIRDATASGNVESSSAGYVGGLIGYYYEPRRGQTLERLFASGDVTSDGEYVGGLIGRAYSRRGSDLNQAAATGTVASTGDEVGGVVGRTTRVTVTEAYATGDVTGDRTVGGLVGFKTGRNSDITDAYTAGNVTGSEYTGGFIGRHRGSIQTSYRDTAGTTVTEAGTVVTGQDIGRNSGSGSPTGLTTADMTTAVAPDTMAGFDFTTDTGTWKTDSEIGYPVFQWQDVRDLSANSSVSGPVTAGDQVTVQLSVTDKNGDPAAGEQIRNIVVESEFDGELLTQGSATVDSTGTLTLTVPGNALQTADGNHTLIVDSPNFENTTAAVNTTTASAAAVRVEVEPSGTPKGSLITPAPAVTVTDEYGNPVNGESVTVSINKHEIPLSGTTTVSTDSTGRAEFTDIRPGESSGYTLTFTLAGDSSVTTTTDPFLRVNNDGSARFETIANATEQAVDGDTIVVESGTYTEAIAFSKNITIEAQGDVILENDSTVVSPVGVNVTSPDGNRLSPTVRGLTIKGFQTGIAEATSDGTEADGSDWSGVNITVADSETGVQASQSTSDWSVDGLALESIGGTGIDASGSAGDWGVSRLTLANGSEAAVNASDATGEWSLSDSTIRNVSGSHSIVDASVTDGTAGDWSINNVTIDASGGTDIPAINVTVANGSEGGSWSVTGSSLSNTTVGVDGSGGDGAWSVSDTSMTNTSVGVEASDVAGDWSVTNASITDTETGVNATGATGEWSVTETTVENSTTGVNVSGASGDWSVSDSAVDNATIGVDASAATGDWSIAGTSVSDSATGVDAGRTAGNWSIDQTTVTNATTGVNAGRSTGDWSLSGSTITAGRSTNATVVGVDAGNSTGDWQVSKSEVTDARSENGSVVGIDTAQNGSSAGNWTVSGTTISDLTSDTDQVTGIDAAGSTGAWTVEGPERESVADQMLIANLQSKADNGDAGGINATGAAGGWTVEYGAINNVSATGTAGTPESYGVKAAGANQSWSMEDTTVSELSANRTVGRATAIDAGNTSQASNWSVSGSTVKDLNASSSTAIRDNTNDSTHAPTLTGSDLTNVASTDSNASVLDFDGTTGNFSVVDTNITEITDTTALSATATSGNWELTKSLLTNVTGTAVRADNSTGDWKTTRSSITNVDGSAVDANNSGGEWLMAFTDISHTASGVSATNSTGNWSVANTKISNVSTVAVSADNAAGNWSLGDAIVQNVSSSTAISNRSSSGRRILVFSSDQSLCDTFGCISTEPVAGNQDGALVSKSVRNSTTSAPVQDVVVRTPASPAGRIEVQLRNGKANESAPLEEKYDLSRAGIDRETRLDLNLTIVGDKPRAIVGNGRDIEWSREQNDDGTWDINITGRPAAIDYNLTANGSSPGSFPDGQNATLGAQSAMILQTKTLESEEELTDTERERLDGAVFTTDAQEFGLLSYDSGFQQNSTEDDRIELTLKAPSITAGGGNNTGYYTANIPQRLVDHWGVELGDIEGFIKPADDETAEPDPTDATVEPNGRGGAVITFETHYSEIDVSVGPAVQEEDGESDGSSESDLGGGGGSDSGGSADDDSGSDDDSVGGDRSDASIDDTDTGGSTGGVDIGVSDESGSSVDGANDGGDGGGSGSDGGSSDDSGGDGRSEAVDSVVASMTAPVRWFGSLSTLGKAAVTVAGGAGLAGAAYSFGGDRVQTPANIARSRAQSWLRRRLRGSTRQQITRLVARLRKRLTWSNVRARLAALRKYFTRSYWRGWFESRRELATREGLRTFLVGTYHSYRKRQWRGWLRGRLRGGVDTVSGGLVTSLSPAWLAPVSGPVGAALGVAIAEVQRWIEDILMGKFDALGKRYSTLVLRSGARITDATDRVWYFLTGETPPTVDPSVSSVAGEHAAALHDVGIESVDQLAAADPDHLANAVAVGPAVIDEWIEQADRRGTKSDRPPIAETVNARWVRQRVGRVTERVATAGTTVVTRPAKTAERSVRSLRTLTAVARTWLREDALPTVIAPARRARTAGRQRTSERATRVRSTVRQLIPPINDQLGTVDSGLQSIDGIGPAYSERLSEAGLTTVDEVARSDPERVAVSIGVSPKRVYRWTAQARSAEWIGQHLRRRVAVRLVKTEVSVAALRDSNPVPLDAAVTSRAWGSLDAPSEAAMRRLSAVDIESVFQLAAADPDRLAAATNFDTDRTAAWVKAARIYQKHIVAH